MKATVKLELLVVITIISPLPCTVDWQFVTANDADNTNDILCNVGSRFECVCHSYAGDSKSIDCMALIKTHVPALRLTVSHFEEWDALSSGGKLILNGAIEVTYEAYFRFHLARILTDYCVQEITRCPDVGLVVRPDSVVILHVSLTDNRQLVVDYCVVNSAAVKEISDNDVVDPQIVLASTQSRLQDVFHPYPIFDHRSITLAIGATTDAWRDNMGLITSLIVFASILIIIYIIAVIKAVRDRAKILQRQTTSASAPRQESNPVAQQASTVYGSIGHQVKPLRAVEEEIDENATNSCPIEHRNSNDTRSANSSNQYARKSVLFPVITDSSNRTIASSRSFPANGFLESMKRKVRIKKAITCDFPMQNMNVDREMIRKASAIERCLMESAEDDAVMESAEDDAVKNTGKESSPVRIPVLIVPAMSKHRDDGDFVKTLGDEGDDAKETDELFSNEILETRSEDSLLSKSVNERAMAYENEVSDSDDTTNSNCGDETLSARIDVGYQPLRDSSWSVNRLESDQMNEHFAEKNDYSDIHNAT